jgi:biopolymer transport protein ExbD
MKAEINVTPLIDILLVLLILFMVVAPVAPRALDASLPRSPDGRDDATPGGLVLEVRADDFALNTIPVFTLEELDRRLRPAFETREGRTLFVRAGADVPYERVVAAIDVAEGAGASRVGLVAETPDPGRR